MVDSFSKGVQDKTLRMIHSERIFYLVSFKNYYCCMGEIAMSRKNEVYHVSIKYLWSCFSDKSLIMRFKNIDDQQIGQSVVIIYNVHLTIARPPMRCAVLEQAHKSLPFHLLRPAGSVWTHANCAILMIFYNKKLTCLLS